MKMLRNVAVFATVCGATLPATARDDRIVFPIREALTSVAAQGKLDPGVRVFFGKQNHPKVIRNFGTWQTNKKTNAFAKTDQQACEWVFLSAMVALQERARKESANAVINISSDYKGIETASESEFVCGAGGLIAGVTLKGTMVTLDGK